MLADSMPIPGDSFEQQCSSRGTAMMTVIDTNDNVTLHLEMLKNRGITAVGRYYSSKAWKRITAQEARAISTAGLDIFVVFENDGDPELTVDAGVFHGQIALAQAKAIGQPRGTAIYFALEHLPDGYKKSHIGGVSKYVRGLREALGNAYKVGVYSDGVICAALLDAGLCEYTWLSASLAFEGSRDFYASGRWSIAQDKHVDQNWDGLSVDENETNGDFGSFRVTEVLSQSDASSAHQLANEGQTIGAFAVGAPGSNFYLDVISKDARFKSVDRIADAGLLEPHTRASVHAIIADAKQLGINLMIFETYRSKERQKALFDQGATQLRNVGVHHYGLACDLVKSINGQPSWKGDFSFLGTLARHHGLVWGGDWGEPGMPHSFVDSDHAQRVTKGRQASLFAGSWYPKDEYDPYQDGAR